MKRLPIPANAYASSGSSQKYYTING